METERKINVPGTMNEEIFPRSLFSKKYFLIKN